MLFFYTIGRPPHLFPDDAAHVGNDNLVFHGGPFLFLLFSFSPLKIIV
jgi:hypothetical protein